MTTPMNISSPQVSGAMIAEGVKHLRLARNSGCGEDNDTALAAVIYLAMQSARTPSGKDTEVGASSGSHASHGAEKSSPPIGFDPARGESFESISAWCEETFGPATAIRMAIRANEEMAELLDAASFGEGYSPKVLVEAADVAICLARFPGLWDAVEAKMVVNRGRTWRLTGEGTGYHVPAIAMETGTAETTGSVGEADDSAAIAQTTVGKAMSDEVSEVIEELREAASLFREHSVYNSEGDEVRLTLNADLDDKAADLIHRLSREG